MFSRTGFLLALVAVSATLSEGLYDPLTAEFFVQRLGWTAEQYATVQGTWGVSGEMVGALSAGFLASRFGGRRLAMVGLALIMGVLLCFSLTSWAWDEAGYRHAVLLPTFRGSIAFTTVSLFTIYMGACWNAAAATQFTLYMALSNIGYAVGSKLNAWLPAMGIGLEYEQYYLVGGLMPMVALGLLLVLGSAHERPPEAPPALEPLPG